MDNPPCAQCLSGKAGKSNFVVHVGAVENLYISRKKSSRLLQQSASNKRAPVLDLHGYTKDEALAGLDENLKTWYDTAMRGSYPFVIKVRIICGCGDQVLSEVVEEWIKSNKNVSNAPSIKCQH